MVSEILRYKQTNILPSFFFIVGYFFGETKFERRENNKQSKRIKKETRITTSIPFTDRTFIPGKYFGSLAADKITFPYLYIYAFLARLTDQQT